MNVISRVALWSRQSRIDRRYRSIVSDGWSDNGSIVLMVDVMSRQKYFAWASKVEKHGIIAPSCGREAILFAVSVPVKANYRDRGYNMSVCKNAVIKPVVAASASLDPDHLMKAAICGCCEALESNGVDYKLRGIMYRNSRSKYFSEYSGS